MSRPRNIRGKPNKSYADYQTDDPNGEKDDDVYYERAVADELEGSEDDEMEELTGGARRKRKRGESARKKNNANSTSSAAQEDDTEIRMLDMSAALELKSDHESRPIWVASNNVILLEAFSPVYKQAYDFLVAVAEPQARPTFIHKYLLTTNSLYAAVSVNIDTDTIISVLGRLCKTDLPAGVVSFIRESTSTFGKAKLVLKDNNFYVESAYPDVLRELLKIPKIAAAFVKVDADGETSKDNFEITDRPEELKQNLQFLEGYQGNEEGSDDEDELVELKGSAGRKILKVVRFKIIRDKVQEVKKCALDAHYPLMQEYDYFKADENNKDLSIDIRPSTRIRAYQEKALAKMFGNGRARSGIIVLPCGAGKSLTGVTACSTVKKSTMVFCINNASVKQWKEQFTSFSTLSEKSIKLFTSENKDQLPIGMPGKPPEACVVITTYSMMCFSGNRSEEAARMINSIKEREWGLMILDEVHVAPAAMFRKVLELVNAHCKLGLTATLVREDNLIKDLHFLVGPKLYEANWMDLTHQGYLANVQCCEVWCPMTPEFYDQYLELSNDVRKQRLLYVLNPAKIRTCEYLVNYHVKRGDKVIIFSDDLVALELYCICLTKQGKMDTPYIWGGTSEADRSILLHKFRTSSICNVIGLSKVGDTALDIPEANVIIQVSSHFGARRQEAQRLGRILRPKPNPTGGFNAFFYTLVSTDTKEMYFSAKRQQYLIDQGYTFKVVQDLCEMAEKEGSLLKTKDQEWDLLAHIVDDKSFLNHTREVNETEEDKAIKKLQGDEHGGGSSSSSSVVRRTQSNVSALSGAGNQSYGEKKRK